MMSQKRAVTITILIAAAIGFAIALSSGLGSLDLEPGTLVETGKSGGFVLRGEPGTYHDVTLPSEGLFNTFLIIFLAASLASAIFMVVNREARPKLLIALFALAALVLLGVFFPRDLARRDEAFVEEETSASEEVLPGPTSEPESRVAVASPEPSGGARWPLIVSAVLAAALAIVAITPLVVFLVRFARRRRTSAGVEEVLAIAEDAAREIESGADPVGVVQQCYARMLRALSKRYSVNPSFRTPREFAVDMREAGLQSESVDNLTEMFELVRYGGRADGQFAQRAHACLSALRLSHEPT